MEEGLEGQRQEQALWWWLKRKVGEIYIADRKFPYVKLEADHSLVMRTWWADRGSFTYTLGISMLDYNELADI